MLGVNVFCATRVPMKRVSSVDTGLGVVWGNVVHLSLVVVMLQESATRGPPLNQACGYPYLGEDGHGIVGARYIPSQCFSLSDVRCNRGILQDEVREGAGPAPERFLTFHHGCNPGACVFGGFILWTAPRRRRRMLPPENDRRIIRKKITARRPSPTCRDF